MYYMYDVLFRPSFKIISVYSKWSEYSSCSKTCGQGEHSRTRDCVGGICSKATSNDMIETKSCMDKECTVLSTWGDWNSCSVTCGPGEQTRLRTCDQGCDDVPNQDLIDKQSCQDKVCTVLSNWTGWSYCSKTCGSGSKTRSRKCYQGCEDVSLRQTQSCKVRECQGTSRTVRLKSKNQHYTI